MKSKLTIDLDQDNQPVIKIDYVYSEDVRDTMVKRFLDDFGADSSWANFRYGTTYVPHNTTDRREGEYQVGIIRPIKPKDMKNCSKNMELAYNQAFPKKENI